MSRSEYITKEVAANRSGRSVRRLLELASTGRIRKQIVRDERNAGRALALFHAGDIAKLAQTAKGEIPTPGSVQIVRPVRPIAALPQGEGATVLSPNPRPWLTLAEAADYTGLPESFLLARITARKLPALDVGVRPGGRWRVARRDLDHIAAHGSRVSQ
jgi:excisionase family DNA binding protein